MMFYEKYSYSSRSYPLHLLSIIGQVDNRQLFLKARFTVWNELLFTSSLPMNTFSGKFVVMHIYVIGVGESMPLSLTKKRLFTEEKIDEAKR